MCPSIGGRPSRSQIYFRRLLTSLPSRSSYIRSSEDRGTCHPRFERDIYERAISPAPSVHQVCSGHRHSCFQISLLSKGNRRKKIIYLSSDGGSIHMLRRSPEDPFIWTILAESTFWHGISLSWIENFRSLCKTYIYGLFFNFYRYWPVVFVLFWLYIVFITRILNNIVKYCWLS